MRRTVVALVGWAMGAALIAAPAPPASGAVGAADDVGLFDPATGRWHLQYDDGRVSSFYFGVPGDIPLLGDWDCDGVDTVALYRQSTGFVYLRNSNDFGIAEDSFFFGNPGDVPIAGDWDGDGCDSFGIFRNGRFYLINALDTAFADLDFFFGVPGDQPFAGDFNGDGKDTVGVHRDGVDWAFITQDLTGLPASGGVAAGGGTFWVGGTGVTVLGGDWDGSGDDTLGTFRPGLHEFRLYNANTAQQPDVVDRFGASGWIPVDGELGPPPPLPALALETVATGFSRPVFLTAPPGDGRLFVVEQGGRIKIIEDGVVDPDPFLDISNQVSTLNEQGLLAMAFHPQFGANRLFYVHYTNTAGDTRVVEYRADPGGPVPVETLLSVDQPAANHNGGMLQFGPDGRLHVALGDGGGGGDPFNTGQNAFTPLASIVGLDVNGLAPDQIWAIGLRNPWRFDWDGEHIYVADVGQNAWEEVSVVSRYAPTRNFGWSVQEGFACYPATVTDCDTSPYVQPVVAYSNPVEGCSVTGGFVYRGWEIDGLHGTYLYSDYCRGWVRGFVYDTGASEITASGEWDLGITSSVPSFGEDADGELYVLTFDGRVGRIVAAG